MYMNNRKMKSYPPSPVEEGKHRDVSIKKIKAGMMKGVPKNASLHIIDWFHGLVSLELEVCYCVSVSTFPPNTLIVHV